MLLVGCDEELFTIFFDNLATNYLQKSYFLKPDSYSQNVLKTKYLWTTQGNKKLFNQQYYSLNYRHKFCPNFVCRRVQLPREQRYSQKRSESSMLQILLLLKRACFLVAFAFEVHMLKHICLITLCLTLLCDYNIDLFLKTMSCSS